MNIQVAALVREPVAMFEVGVACEVFGLDRIRYGAPAFDFAVCSEHPGEVLHATTGPGVVATEGLDYVRGAAIVLVPACGTARPGEPYMDALRDAAARGAYVLSICSGSFALGYAGLLDGRECTTHWKYLDDLTRLFPAARISGDVLYTHDRRILTSAGTAAGVDACLYLVRHLYGQHAANVIARQMVVPPHRDGGQRQYVDNPLPQDVASSLEPLTRALLDDLGGDHTIESMARQASMSPRTLARRFVAEAGVTPHEWLTGQRVLRARHLLEETMLPLEDVARECGFSGAALLRHHFAKTLGTTPSAYRRRFGCRDERDCPTASS